MGDPSRYLGYVLNNDPDEKIDQRSDLEPSEKTVVESLAQTLKQSDDLWVETEVNLWTKKARAEGSTVPPQEAIQEFDHPLQPDIDLLLGSHADGRRTPPLVGVEAKYFGRYSGIQGHKLLPKRIDAHGHPTGGFYSGLGQALSLASMGLDRVYLWHVFEINEEIYSPATETGDQTTDHRDILRNYTTRVKDILEAYDLPVGYFAHGMAVDHGNKFIRLCTPRQAPKRSPRDDPALREFLERSLLQRGDTHSSDRDDRAPEQSLSDLRGSGEPVTVEGEVIDILYVKKDVPEMPDLKGVLRDSATGTRVCFVVDPGVIHPYFEEGVHFRFENAIDHHYAAEDELQIRITKQTNIITQ